MPGYGDDAADEYADLSLLVISSCFVWSSHPLSYSLLTSHLELLCCSFTHNIHSFCISREHARHKHSPWSYLHTALARTHTHTHTAHSTQHLRRLPQPYTSAARGLHFIDRGPVRAFVSLFYHSHLLCHVYWRVSHHQFREWRECASSPRCLLWLLLCRRRRSLKSLAIRSDRPLSTAMNFQHLCVALPMEQQSLWLSITNLTCRWPTPA